MWTYLNDNSELCTYSLALAGESSPTYSPDMYPSALSKLMPTADQFSFRGSETASCQSFRSGMTSSHSTASRGADTSISSQVDSPARTSPPLDEGQVSPEHIADCGEKWHESLARYDHNSRSWRTRQCSFLGGLTLYSETWPRWGTTRDGGLYPLPRLVRSIGANASGLWPAPRAHDGVAAMLPTPTAAEYGSQGGAAGRRRPSLSSMARRGMWPPPRSADGERGGRGDLLLWATPTGRDRGRNAPKRKGSASLGVQARRFPTPVAQDGKNNNSPARQRRNSAGFDVVAGGSLNPDWVDLLMGWPRGWTSPDPLPAESWQRWLDGDVWREGWEDGIPRVTTDKRNRVARLRAIGNGQVPQCAATAWEVLTA